MVFKINSPKYGTVEVLIDEEDYNRIKKYHWTVAFKPDINNFYIKCHPKSSKSSQRTTEKLHRFIMNAPEGSHVDHINHNTLDNRKSNLRICTHEENCRNKQKRKKDKRDNSMSSKYKGVCFRDDSNKFRATISFNKKRISLGCYENEEDAAKAYNEAAIKYHGEFAVLNILHN